MTSSIESYSNDMRRVLEEIWGGIEIPAGLVIDVGIGTSTEELVKRGAKVVVVEKEFENVRKWDSLGVPILLCDFLSFPFQKRIAEMTVFSFTLHEINPVLHLSALQLAGEIAPRVLVIEPSPTGCRAYEEFAELWRGAMHEVGRFEEYQPARYWEELLKEAGFGILRRRTVTWNVDVPKVILRKLIMETIAEWERLGVSKVWINALSEFLEKHTWMRWSDIIVIEGEAGE